MNDLRVLLVFHSGEGQTAKVAEHIATTMTSAGAEVEMVDAVDAPPPTDHDGVVLGDSIHAGRHSRALTRYVSANADALAKRPLALFQVSLTSATDDEPHRAEAAALLRRLTDPAGIDPDLVGLFAGALAYTRYGWIKRRLMGRVAATDGRDTEVLRDHEYTDWEAVEHFAKDAVALMTSQAG